MSIRSVQARCLNCKKEVKDDQEICGCGDRVKPHIQPVAVPFYASGEQDEADRAAIERLRQLPDPPGTQQGLGTVAGKTVLPREQEQALQAIAAWFSA